MRGDTQAAIAKLNLDKGSNKRYAKKAALIEELESRLSPERVVKVVLYTVGHGGPGGSDAGMLLISDYGLHWKGETGGSPRLDLPWGKLHRAEVVEDKGDFDLEAESSDPNYTLSFRIYKDAEQAALVRGALSDSQPLL
jgi:hypothetical protein